MPDLAKLDPTRTFTLRRAFQRDVGKRFDRLKAKLLRLINVEDAFGIKPKKPFTLNVFCPTGKGGGVDPTCSPGGSSRTNHVSPQGVSYSISGLTDSNHINAVKATFEKMPPILQQAARGVNYSPEGGTYARPGHYISVGKGINGPETRLSIYLHEAGHSLMSDKSDHPDVKGWGSIRAKDKSPEGWTPYTKIGTEDFAESVRYYVQGNAPGGTAYEGMTFREAFPLRAEALDRIFGSNLTTNTRWKFNTTQDQVDQFRQWLSNEIDNEILSDPETVEDDWWTEYVKQGYEKGAGRAFDDVNKPAKSTVAGKVSDFYLGSKDQFLRSSFANPQSRDKLKLLSGRVYTDLKGVTDAMAAVMTRVLTDGLAQGKNPRDIARDLIKAIEGIGKSRAQTIARTEVIRAHAEGQLDALESMGIEEIGVAVEWITAGNVMRGSPVCPLCKAMEGVVLKVKEAHGLIPKHPNCRCAFMPANVGEPFEPQQKKSAKSIQKALDKTIDLEDPDEDKTLEEKRKDSKWPGADLEVDENRPKSILNRLYNYFWSR